MAINGRFLAQRITGLQRFAVETLRALDSLLDSKELRDRFGFEVLAPPGVAAPALRNITFTNVGRGGGVLWDQTWLPLHSRERMLVSVAAVGSLQAPAADHAA